MSKMKRVLAMGLVSVMVFGMLSMMASANDGGSEIQNADTETTLSDAVTSIPVQKNVNVTQGVQLPEETFYVRMTPATDIQAGTKLDNVEIKSGIELETDVVSFQFGSNNNTASGTVSGDPASFDLTQFKNNASFSGAGVYRYYITEVIKTESNDTTTYSELPAKVEGASYYIEYDYTKYIVDLVVSAGSGGSGYYVKNVQVTKVVDGQGNAFVNPKDIVFTNTINCANIVVTKTVEGDPYADNEEFTFRMLIPEAGDTITLADAVEIQAVRRNIETGKEIGTYSFEVQGETIDSDIVDNGNVFQLCSGEELVITAPVSMIYKIQEDSYSSEGYTTTATYKELGTFTQSHTLTTDNLTLYNLATTGSTTVEKDGAEETTVWVRGTTNTDVNQVSFKNERHDPTVNSGINLDFLPYVLILALALAGGTIFLVKKRRTAR